jgi:hypothetical protein
MGLLTQTADPARDIPGVETIESSPTAAKVGTARPA